MRDVLMVAALIAVTLVAAAVPAGVIYALTSSEDHQKGFLNEFLSKADLRVDNETWSALLRFTTRRARWGAIGAGVGFGMGLPIFQVLDPGKGDWGTAFNLGMMFAGMAFGNALSSQITPVLPDEGTRVSTLAPHSVLDYLRPREVVAEAAVAVLGVAISISGLVLLVIGRTSESTTVVVLVMGLLVSANTGLAVLLQRRLVTAPVRAEGQAHLVAHDVRLAIGLRDLMGIPLFTVLMCGYGFLLWAAVPFWVPYASLILSVGLARLIYDPKRSRAMAPVAQRLTGAHPA